MDEEERRAKRKRGCLIALAVVGALAACCGIGVGVLGWRVASNESVQVGFRAAGAAMEMNQAALTAPGAQALRDAGCGHALVYSPALMARFVEDVEAPGDRIVAPTHPLLVCASRAAPPSCEAVVATWVEASGERPAGVLVNVFVAEEAAPRCLGVYDADGARVRDQTEDEGRFSAIVRPQVF